MPDTGGAARADLLSRYDAVLALSLYFLPESLSGVSRLKIIARWGVGYDRIDVAACTQNDVLLAITPRAVRRPVAEGILALIFSLAKDLRKLDRLCRSGLDVFETEPIAADDPLLKLENVIVSPHGIAWTQGLCRDNSEDACRNIIEVFEGRIPEHVVNREVLQRPGFQSKLAPWRTN